MGYKRSDSIEEEISLLQRVLDDEDFQDEKEKELGDDYDQYYADLQARLVRLQADYDDAILKGE